jgi:hypothetical protein
LQITAADLPALRDLAAELRRLVAAQADTGELLKPFNRLLDLLRPFESGYGDLKTIALEPRLRLEIVRLWRQANAVSMPDWLSAEDLAKTIEALLKPQKGKLGRPSKAEDALAYARKLRADYPKMTTREIRFKLLKRFPKHILPDEPDPTNPKNTRRWMSRKRKNEAK